MSPLPARVGSATGFVAGRRARSMRVPIAAAICLLSGAVVHGGEASRVRAAPYVPAPRVADTGQYRVGALMCPLWGEGRRWNPITAYPDREPLLGWYDEGDPEVTDWEVTWALDHGISFFLVCWYRAKGNFKEPVVRPALSHWLHEGLPRSRYGDRMKFAILWENANDAFPCPTSGEDFLQKLVPFWIEEYFRRPNYLILDSCPVFAVFSHERFVRDLGGEAQAAAALEAMREACVRAGFAGVRLWGQSCWGAPPKLERMADGIRRVGFDLGFGYHWPTFTGTFGGGLRPGSEPMMAAQEEIWRRQPRPHIPTVSVGWDEEPWNFRYSKVQWQLTPAEFKSLCQRAKRLLDERHPDDADARIVLLDNWNEFGEGHYLMPTRRHGFGYLDAVREVFAPNAGPHETVTPADLGLGPYDRRYRAWKTAAEGNAP